MGTKQIQMEFQVVADDQVSANVTVVVNGTQVFSGALAKTADVMPGQVFDDQTPFSLVEFDLDVADMPDPLTSSDPSDQYGQWTTPVDVTISVTGGDVTLQATEANYTGIWITNPNPTPGQPYIVQKGSADQFYELRISSQPKWNGVELLDRYNFADNTNTGTGSLLVLENETVAYQMGATLYSAA